MDAVQCLGSDDFLGNGAQVVGERDDVIAIPADPTADMQEDGIEEEKDRGNFVGDRFGGMKVAGIQAEQFMVFDRIAQVEFMGADDSTFRADAEEFAFDRVEVPLFGDGFSEDGVQ